MKFSKKIKIILDVCCLSAVLLLYFADYFNLIPRTAYFAEDLGIPMLYSKVDFNGNGTDDYTDFVLGARKDAQNHPKYDGSYFEGGFPPENTGVCTDVIWRAFKNAGYDLRKMVDADIASRPNEYRHIKTRDSNIDFRRVENLRIYFKNYAVSLTTNTSETAEWQAGDIIIFNNSTHIGIVSDKRNKQGIPYIIHNAGQPNREEDYLKRASVTEHFRFDASEIDHGFLAEWEYL